MRARYLCLFQLHPQCQAWHLIPMLNKEVKKKGKSTGFKPWPLPLTSSVILVFYLLESQFLICRMGIMMTVALKCARHCALLVLPPPLSLMGVVNWFSWGHTVWNRKQDLNPGLIPKTDCFSPRLWLSWG